MGFSPPEPHRETAGMKTFLTVWKKRGGGSDDRRENVENKSGCKHLLHNGFLILPQKCLSAKVTSPPLISNAFRILKTCVSWKPEKWKAVITISIRLMAVYLSLGYLQVAGKLNFKLPWLSTSGLEVYSFIKKIPSLMNHCSSHLKGYAEMSGCWLLPVLSIFRRVFQFQKYRCASRREVHCVSICFPLATYLQSYSNLAPVVWDVREIHSQ